jgi:hypothetical protein
VAILQLGVRRKESLDLGLDHLQPNDGIFLRGVSSSW